MRPLFLALAAIVFWGGSVDLGDLIKDPTNFVKYRGYSYTFTNCVVMYRYDHPDPNRNLTILVATSLPIPSPRGESGALADNQVVAIKMRRTAADAEKILAGSIVSAKGSIQRIAANDEKGSSIYYIKARKVSRKEGGVVPTRDFLNLAEAVARHAEKNGIRSGYGLLLLIPALALIPATPFS